MTWCTQVHNREWRLQTTWWWPEIPDLHLKKLWCHQSLWDHLLGCPGRLQARNWARIRLLKSSARSGRWGLVSPFLHYILFTPWSQLMKLIFVCLCFFLLSLSNRMRPMQGWCAFLELLPPFSFFFYFNMMSLIFPPSNQFLSITSRKEVCHMVSIDVHCLVSVKVFSARCPQRKKTKTLVLFQFDSLS